MIITEFSDWLWGHIFAGFSKKKERNGDSESLATLLSGTNVAILWRPLKKYISIQSWALEIFSVEVFHYFWSRCHNQRRRGSALARKALFLAASSTPPKASNIINPAGTNTINFMNWLSWEGCGGKSVCETRKDGIWRCPTRILTVLYFSSIGWFR